MCGGSSSVSVCECVSAIAHQPVKHPLQTANPHSHCAAEVYHLTGAPSSPSHIVL